MPRPSPAPPSASSLRVDLERLGRRARILRAVELSPGLADCRGHMRLTKQVVPDRLKDRLEHIVREVVEGLLAVNIES